MKAAWIAPFLLALAATPALASDTGNNDQQTIQTQGSVSPNAINPGQGKQPDGHAQGGDNQQHTDDFGASPVSNAQGDNDSAASDDDASKDGKSGTDSSASAGSNH
ncbi:hypothetical protein [Kushneria marisflavi]|uniref:Uncharacterized protein n=1 Tax=Kushneria marisflavi TaxID=157779 RepID=A0A240ULI0_9GAMM|nr:hypothetical protein [Kushneria marisflavi]ART62351.1 hypothetical protein B9H00_04065 [Kushneria marisflavi]RKD87459.1 hypothetical protein C8D96_0935 [Kushneria marisflavi]